MPVSRREFTAGAIATAASLACGKGISAAENELIRRPVPSSGELIPVMGVGTNRYGVGDDVTLRAPLRAALEKFHQLGGTVIDTAPGYRTSETVLGDLLADIGNLDDFFIATKVDREDRADSEERMEASFRKLRMQVCDLMQVHNLRGWQDSIPLMKEWKNEGRIRYIGITTSRENQYEELEKIMRAHDLDFVQVNYSLAGQRSSADRLLPLASERGMAVLINRPFGGGGVFSKLSQASLPEWAAEFDVTSWAQFLLKYALSHPAVTCAIPGMTKARHVEDNFAAARGRMPTARHRKQQEAFFDGL